MNQKEKAPGMIGVRLEGDLMEKVREEAENEHRTLAGMVRVFIIEAIEARELQAVEDRKTAEYWKSLGKRSKKKPT